MRPHSSPLMWFVCTWVLVCVPGQAQDASIPPKQTTSASPAPGRSDEKHTPPAQEQTVVDGMGITRDGLPPTPREESDGTGDDPVVGGPPVQEAARSRQAEGDSDALKIARIEVDIDRPKSGERSQVIRYLQSFFGATVTVDLAQQAEKTLLRLERYRSAVCRISEVRPGARLKCGLTKARTIRSVNVDGLPWQLLETDLRKRIFLRPGEALERADASGRDRVARQRTRIEDYLERQGFFGADVDVLTPPVPGTSEVDLDIRVRGGSFVRVRNVRVESWLPLSKHELQDRFGGMCRTPDGILTALDTGEFSCFTRERLRETIDRFEEKLRRDGYPEGRVQVETEFVDPMQAKGIDHCFVPTNGLFRLDQGPARLPPRCVDLVIRVRTGPHLVTTMTIHPDTPAEGMVGNDHGAPIYDGFLNPAYRFLTSLTSFDLFLWGSRALQLGLSADLTTSNDTLIRMFELEDALTFREARSTDETEAALSKKALLDVLAARGYLTASIDVTRREFGADRVEIHYDIWPGSPLAVHRISLAGNLSFSDEELMKESELVTHVRDLIEQNGFVSISDLDDDVIRLQTFYETRGYREASVSWRVNVVSPGVAEVIFDIDEGVTRFQIAGVRFIGGVSTLYPRILNEIRHCAAPSKLRLDPVNGLKDCAGNPLLPDELEVDAQRVLNVYAAAGYPYASARVEISQEWTDAGPYLEIRVAPLGWEPPGNVPTAIPPAPTRVERGVVFIEGNTKTDRGVILKEMRIDESKALLLDPVEISRGVSRLRRTGVFARVGFDYIGVEEQSDRVHLRLQVEERPTLTLDTAVGFSTDNLFVSRIELRDRNFGGRMLDVGALVDLGLFVGRFSQAQLRLRWPRILGSNVDLTIQPSAVYSDTPSGAVPRVPGKDGVVDAIVSWTAPDLRRRLFTAGNSVGLEWHPLPETEPGLVAGISYELGVRYDNPEAYRIPVFSEESFATVDGLLDVFRVPEQRFGFIAPRLAYTSLSNPFDPDAGWTGELTLRLGSPWLGGEESFVLTTARSSVYLGITDGTVLALNGRFWWGTSDLQGNGTSALLSPELLLLGGDRTVRGFNASALFGPSSGPFGLVGLPAELSADAYTRDELLILGGQFNLELRQTLLRDFFLGDVKGALFADVGFVTDDLGLPWLDPFALYQATVTERLDAAAPLPTLLGASVGAGLRYVLPVGPMSLDVAYSPTHQQVGVHFQFGYAF